MTLQSTLPRGRESRERQRKRDVDIGIAKCKAKRFLNLLSPIYRCLAGEEFVLQVFFNEFMYLLNYLHFVEKERKQRAAFLANSVVGSTSSLRTKERVLRNEDLIDRIEREELARLEEKDKIPSSRGPRRHNGTPTNNGKQTVKYVILYSYDAGGEDELNLEAGDFVDVVETCEDGWFVGTCKRTGAFGTFPGNYAALPQHQNGKIADKA